jgi:hypothetical protein
MTPLLYLMAFGWTLALFASLIGCAGWMLIKLWRWLAEPPDPAKEAAKKQLKSLNLSHLKRAGQ